MHVSPPISSRRARAGVVEPRTWQVHRREEVSCCLEVGRALYSIPWALERGCFPRCCACCERSSTALGDGAAASSVQVDFQTAERRLWEPLKLMLPAVCGVGMGFWLLLRCNRCCCCCCCCCCSSHRCS